MASGKRRQVATAQINMKQYAGFSTQQDVRIKFRPLSKKVVAATLDVTLSCLFLREGKATYVPIFIYIFACVVLYVRGLSENLSNFQILCQ